MSNRKVIYIESYNNVDTKDNISIMFLVNNQVMSLEELVDYIEDLLVDGDIIKAKLVIEYL